MFYDICFYNNTSNNIGLCPNLDYADGIIRENLKAFSSLRGKRQLSIIRREDGFVKLVFVIYNYVYTESSDSFGVCIILRDYFPNRVEYLFDVFGNLISGIIEEGILLFLDKDGVIHAGNCVLGRKQAVVKHHIDSFITGFDDKKLKLEKLSTLSYSYFNKSKNQSIVHQLSDKSWTIKDSLNYNNVVVVTEEIEEENINSMRSVILKSNATIDNLKKQIDSLQAQLFLKDREDAQKTVSIKDFTYRINCLNEQIMTQKEICEQKSKKIEELNEQIEDLKKQLITKNKEFERKLDSFERKRDRKNNYNWRKVGQAVLDWAFAILMIVCSLYCLVFPWFLPTIWPKTAVVLTGLGIAVFIYALNNDLDGLAWGCVGAVFLSTIMVTIGLLKKTEMVDNKEPDVTLVQDTIPTRKIADALIIPKDFVYISSGTLRQYFNHRDDNGNAVYKDWMVEGFYICKYEVIQKDYESLMGSNPSKIKGDSLPVHGVTNYDAVIYCNKKSKAEGFDGFYKIERNKKVKVKENGNGYRLPTDHEWVLAARSGEEKTTKYAAGDNLKDIAWCGENSDNMPHKIGQKQPNGRGLFDMNGNIRELCLFEDGKVWGKGGSYKYNVLFEEEGGTGGGETLGSTKEPLEDSGLRLVFIPINNNR